MGNFWPADVRGCAGIGCSVRTYKSWTSFKTALNARLPERLPDSLWSTLEEILFSAAIHPPFSDGDIEFALRKIKRLWGISRRKLKR